jgi:hypothetical protein
MNFEISEGIEVSDITILPGGAEGIVFLLDDDLLKSKLVSLPSPKNQRKNIDPINFYLLSLEKSPDQRAEFIHKAILQLYFREMEACNSQCEGKGEC